MFYRRKKREENNERVFYSVEDLRKIHEQ